MDALAFRRTARAGFAGVSLLGASTLFAFSSAPLAGAALPGATTFNYAGAAQNYVVPADVCQVKIEALGASGGLGGLGGPHSVELERLAAKVRSAMAAVDDEAPAAAGKGGSATSTITVTPGETLSVSVGGHGDDGLRFVGEGESTMAKGGWNGGGDAGSGGVSGGGGGGASDVRQGGTSLSDRVVVAGGGGGSGGYSTESDEPLAIGGNGGNPATPGGDGLVPSPVEKSAARAMAATASQPARGGGAATVHSAGAGGIGMVYVAAEGVEPEPLPAGTSGALGSGGTGGGGGDASRQYASGGGGGGGLFGGGGGGATWQELAAGGGGGSSLGDTTLAGVNSGDGQVTITPVGSCAKTPPAVAPATEAKPAVAVATKPTYTG